MESLYERVFVASSVVALAGAGVFAYRRSRSYLGGGTPKLRILLLIGVPTLALGSAAFILLFALLIPNQFESFLSELWWGPGGP